MRKGLSQEARRLGDQLRSTMLPWWALTVDKRHGGYVLAPDEKQLATQSRMIWVFSHAHRNHLGDYLAAAEQGVEFLLARFRDSRHGGFFWNTDRVGRVRSDRKILYGHLFVIHALVEYVRAGGSRALLAEARALFELLIERAHDDEHGGWLEHFSRRWRPARRPARGYAVDIPGLKSANTHLHAVESLAELCVETGDPDAAAILTETIDLSQAYFFPPDPGASVKHRTRDWRVSGRAGISHGHNVEFAWLLVHAERVLGRTASRCRFDAYLHSMLSAERSERIWWEEAELLAALATGLVHWPDPRRENVLERHLAYLVGHVIDPVDGVWHETIADDGSVLSPGKVGIWKDAFHEVRATSLLLDALSGSLGDESAQL